MLIILVVVLTSVKVCLRILVRYRLLLLVERVKVEAFRLDVGINALHASVIHG